MSFSLKKNIGQRFILWILVILFSIFILFFIIFIPYDAINTEAELNHQADHIMSFSEQSLPSAMWQYNNKYIKDYIDTLFLYEDVVFVHGVADGKVIKTKTRNGYRHIDFLANPESDEFIIRSVEIVYDKQPIGKIIFAISKNRVKKQIYKNIIVVISLFAVIASIASIAIVLLFKKNILKPILSLNYSARQISNGDLNTQINTSSEDEIGQLAKNFSFMMQNIRSITASRDDLTREVNERKKIEKKLLEEKNKLQTALSEIKVLRGILPVCSYCKKIRDDKGYWNQIEAYIMEHSDAEFSHGICKDCSEKHYPNFNLHDEKDP